METPHFKIVLVGAGNVATHLLKQLQKKGHEVLQVVSRSSESARKLSLSYNIPFTTDLKKINRQADIYILCVPDDEIEKIAKELKLVNKLVLHTSGSVSQEALKKISQHYGVLYPLQSFSKTAKVSFKKMPFLIEGNNAATLSKIKQLAVDLSKNIHEVNSTNRLKFHLAAVFVNNFSNHIFALANDFLLEEKAGSLDLLMPLLKQTVKKLNKLEPAEAQTGPARRKDGKTIEKHMKLLETHPAHKKVYKVLTDSILDFYER